MAFARFYVDPSGLEWAVEVRSPGSSNAMVVFHHPNGARFDRYNWFISHGPESRSVTARLSPADVLDVLTDEDLAMLFRRAMPVSSAVPVGQMALGGNR